PSNCAPVRASPGRAASPGSTRLDLRTPLHRLPPARETRSWLPAAQRALATETADRLVPGRSLLKLQTTSRSRPDLEERSARDRRRACAPSPPSHPRGGACSVRFPRPPTSYPEVEKDGSGSR